MEANTCFREASMDPTMSKVTKILGVMDLTFYLLRQGGETTNNVFPSGNSAHYFSANIENIHLKNCKYSET